MVLTLKNKSYDVYAALQRALDTMKRNYVDRVVLSLDELDSKGREPAGWINLKNNGDYYPFEFLTPDEQEMILKGKDYEVIALVQNEVKGIVKYPTAGMELYQRRKQNLFLPPPSRQSQ